MLYRVEVTAPEKKPTGAFWDDAIGGILVGNTRSLLPDPQICLKAVQPGGQVGEVCGPICKDSRTCEAEFSQFGGGVTVYDVDLNRNREVMLRDAQVGHCDPPCTFPTAGGPVIVAVKTAVHQQPVAPGPGHFCQPNIRATAECRTSPNSAACARMLVDQGAAVQEMHRVRAAGQAASMTPAEIDQLMNRALLPVAVTLQPAVPPDVVTEVYGLFADFAPTTAIDPAAAATDQRRLRPAVLELAARIKSGQVLPAEDIVGIVWDGLAAIPELSSNRLSSIEVNKTGTRVCSGCEFVTSLIDGIDRKDWTPLGSWAFGKPRPTNAAATQYAIFIYEDFYSRRNSLWEQLEILFEEVYHAFQFNLIAHALGGGLDGTSPYRLQASLSCANVFMPPDQRPAAAYPTMPLEAQAKRFARDLVTAVQHAAR
jgi:hypothetical protein